MGAHMLALQQGFRRILAMIGLVAVLLGALEHENLILQPAGVEPAIADAPGKLAYALTEASPDSGTEGTFRSELHRLWLGPRAEITYVPRAVPGGSAYLPGWLAECSLAGRRSLTGRMPLRL